MSSCICVSAVLDHQVFWVVLLKAALGNVKVRSLGLSLPIIIKSQYKSNCLVKCFNQHVCLIVYKHLEFETKTEKTVE